MRRDPIPDICMILVLIVVALGCIVMGGAIGN
jgi:hypothetical protein